jgi:PAS domain S-box-containing protein
MQILGKTPEFLFGGGEMGELIRNFDWSKTPLGPPEHWDQSLKTCVRIMLTSSQPIWIGWGKELIKLYNDPYKAILGGKHPQALGQPASIVWKDIWKDIEPMLKQVMEEDEGTYVESQLLIMERYGYPEETYYTFSYSPVPGDNGGTAGMICYNTADTERIITERSLKTLKELGALSKKKKPEEVYTAAAEVLKANNKDFPCAVIYKIDEEKRIASAFAFAGIDKDHPELPETINLDVPGITGKNLSKAVIENTMVVSNTAKRWKNLPTGYWSMMPKQFVHIPISGANKKYPLAVLSAALNPYRKFDDAYKNFVQLISDQISLEVNNVLTLEEERKRAEALAEIDKAKTLFFTNISHEFRTPLTLMLGPIEEALKDPDSIPDNIARLDVAHRNAIRLLKLVNTLLDFSRIESGRQKANFVLTDIIAFTTNLTSNFRSVMEKAGLQLIVSADNSIPPVYIDREMWEKIVFNLLSNAFKYTLKGSIAVQLSAENNRAVLRVKDTGAGVPESEMPHMFERFHRVQNTTGRSFEGTGIGLSLTKELVQLHGGDIIVESKQGAGSTFTVSIPLGKEHLPHEQIATQKGDLINDISAMYVEEAVALIDSIAAKNKSEAAHFQNKNEKFPLIMIVDDNTDMRMHIETLLSSKFNTVTASNGADALNKIKESAPDLVLSDIMMPVMDGIELLKTIKTNNQTENIPVILLTARAGEESKIEGWETGADDYLVKPFSSKELIARIEAQIKITKKRRAAEKQLHDLFIQAPTAIQILKGPEFIYELVNERSLELMGKSKEEVIGRRVIDVMPEAVEQGFISLLQKVYNTGERHIAEEAPVYQIRNGKKVKMFTKFVFEPLRDDEGMIKGVMITGDDVTAQVLARKKN